MNIRLFFPFLVLSLVAKADATAQVYTYYLNTDLASVDRREAAILGKGTRAGELFRLDCLSINGKHLFMTAHFKDSTLKTYKGPFISYHNNKQVETTGTYDENLREGTWLNWDSSGRMTDSMEYKRGLVYYSAQYKYWKNRITYKSYKDSMKNTFQSTYYDTTGNIHREGNFIGNTGILKTYKDGTVYTDSVFSREEIGPEYVGGAKAWSLYVRSNLRADIPIENNAPMGTYTVIIRFTIMPDGTVGNVEAETNHGYGMEKEGLRIINQSKSWKPASLYGKNVEAYRRQPITFVIQGK